MALSEEHKSLLLGLVMMLMGGLVVFAAYDIGPMAGTTMHAPRWVVALGGLVFVGGGVMLASPPGILGHLFMLVIVGSLTTVCIWIALGSDARQFSGGLPLVPREVNTLLGRGLFGLVALIGIAILANALRHAIATLFPRRVPRDRE